VVAHRRALGVNGLRAVVAILLVAVISDDGLALYFGARGREDADTHVYMATRPDTSSPFGTPVRVVPWPGYSAPGWITADECRLYVAIGGAFAGTRLMAVQRK
jgi:hypothetical protein